MKTTPHTYLPITLSWELDLWLISGAGGDRVWWYEAEGTHEPRSATTQHQASRYPTLLYTTARMEGWS
ncbi:hypothetical protein Hamer_G027502 [Homarus americanus]|uniref:Uncharacterized protein n=1 Tax=Homarus americanus TaxID=6706 RepID=A0A8J5JL46_HOMAM|nr:hypothetical protein Hamer_G027502 [Homarus americanus]